MEHIIFKYFPDLSDRQKECFGKMLELYPEWNARINVISRKDIDNLDKPYPPFPRDCQILTLH